MIFKPSGLIDIFDYLLPSIIYFIIFIKVIFLFMALSYIYLNNFSNDKSLINKYLDKALFWKERTEYIFTICTAILLIFIFNPSQSNIKKYMTTEIKILFFLFGWILIITANWEWFISEAPWYKYVFGEK